MGRDKARVVVAGTAMAESVARALRAAGAADVVAIGREPGQLSDLGLVSVPDEVPGSGPVGGIVTALRRSRQPIVFVAGCDLVTPSAPAMAATVATLAHHPAASVAVPHLDGRPQWAHSAWRRSAEPALRAAFAAGERAVGRAVAAAGLVVVDVRGVAAAALADADTPADLPRGDAGHA